MTVAINFARVELASCGKMNFKFIFSGLARRWYCQMIHHFFSKCWWNIYTCYYSRFLSAYLLTIFPCFLINKIPITRDWLYNQLNSTWNVNRTVVWDFEEVFLKEIDSVRRYILLLLPPSLPCNVDVMAGTPIAMLCYEVILLVEASTETGVEKWKSGFITALWRSTNVQTSLPWERNKLFGLGDHYFEIFNMQMLLILMQSYTMVQRKPQYIWMAEL